MKLAWPAAIENKEKILSNLQSGGQWMIKKL
jgi:hypothetical protein